MNTNLKKVLLALASFAIIVGAPACKRKEKKEDKKEMKHEKKRHKKHHRDEKEGKKVKHKKMDME